jgi:hypothetical protein
VRWMMRQRLEYKHTFDHIDRESKLVQSTFLEL